MRNMISAAIIALAPPAGAASAATFDFSGYRDGYTAGPVIEMPGAVITSGGTRFSIIDAANDRFCPVDPVGCAADMRIDFLSPVTNLSFDVYGFMYPDAVKLSVFGLGDALLQSFELLSDYNNLDLASLGQITALVFDDHSEASFSNGLSYGDFQYDQVAPVPLPAAGGFLMAGLVGLGALARKRRKTA